MDPLFYLMTYFIIISLLIKKNLSPASLYSIIWLALFTNFYFGPLTYETINGNGHGYYFIIAYLSTFLIFYNISSLLSSRYRSKDINENHIRKIEFIGAIGVSLLFFGRLITAYPFLISLDFNGLRSSFTNDVNILSQTGSVISGLFMIVLTRIIFFGFKLNALTKISLFLFLATPIFSAGRQLYFQIILIFLIGFKQLYTSKPTANNYQYTQNNKGKIKLLFILGGSALLFSIFISILRFDETSSDYFGSKLLMLNSYSNTQLKESYSQLYYILPATISDLFIEYIYYFGAQIPKFSEFFYLNNFEFFNFGFIEKFPIIHRNLIKIMQPFGMFDESINSPSIILGNIAGFTWSTSIGGNINSLGYFGTFLFQAIFGIITGYSYITYKRSPKSYAAFNFCVANTVILIYDIMFSVLSDTTFLFYYATSIYIFLKSIKKYMKINM